MAWGDLVTCYTEHAGRVAAIAWSPDSRFLASASGGQVHIWEASTGVRKLAHGDPKHPIVSLVAWSATGHLIASASQGRGVDVWDAHSGQSIQCYTDFLWWPDTLAWSPKEQVLAVGAFRFVHLWSPPAASALQVWEAHERDYVESLTWAPDGAFLACYGGLQLQMWDMRAGERVWSIPCGRIKEIAWSPDGQRLAGVEWHGHLQIWKATQGAVQTQWQGPSLAYDLAWSPDGVWLAIASGSRGEKQELGARERSAHDDLTRNVVQIWDGKTGQLRCTYLRHTGQVLGVEWSPDGTYLASASDDGTVHVWSGGE